MFRRNHMMFTLMILTLSTAACGLDDHNGGDTAADSADTGEAPETTGSDGESGHGDGEPSTGAPEGDDDNTTAEPDASTTGSDGTTSSPGASTGDGEDTTGEPGAPGGDSQGDSTTGGDSTAGDSTTGGDSTAGDSTTGGDSTAGDSVACEGNPCVTNDDCRSGLDDLMCLPITSGPRICVESCDPADAQACDGQPERCTSIDVAMVCLPPIVKAPDVAGACVPV